MFHLFTSTPQSNLRFDSSPAGEPFGAFHILLHNLGGPPLTAPTTLQRNFTRSQERISPRSESALRFLHIHAYVRLIVKIVAAGQAGYQHAVRGGIYVRCIHAAYVLARAYRRANLLFGQPQAARFLFQQHKFVFGFCKHNECADSFRNKFWRICKFACCADYTYFCM